MTLVMWHICNFSLLKKTARCSRNIQKEHKVSWEVIMFNKMIQTRHKIYWPGMTMDNGQASTSMDHKWQQKTGKDGNRLCDYHQRCPNDHRQLRDRSRSSAQFTVLSHGMLVCFVPLLNSLFYPMVCLAFCHTVMLSSLFYPMVWIVCFVNVVVLSSLFYSMVFLECFVKL